MGQRMAITAKWLVVSAGKVLKDHGLVCEDGKIVAVKHNRELAGEQNLVDKSDCILSPGFVNSHHHMYECIAKGMPSTTGAKSLKPILEEYWWPMVENRITTPLIEVTTKHAVLHMLKAGYTCVADILEAPNAEHGTRLVTEQKVMEQAGMKAVLSVEANERLSTALGESAIQENYAFAKQQMAGDGRVRGMMCTHTTFSSSIGFLRRARKLSRELDGRIQIHMDEGPDEGNWCYKTYAKLPAQLYEEIDFLDDKLLAGQCVTMDPVELDLLARNRVNITHQPISNCVNGDGFAPVPDMLEKGMCVGLGTDGSVCNPFETMRFAACIHRSARLDLTLLPSATLFKMATENGAKAIGFENLGTLEVGHYADFLVMPCKERSWIDEHSVVDEIVMNRNPADIEAVYTDGVLRCENGTVLGLDEEEVEQALSDASREFRRV